MHRSLFRWTYDGNDLPDPWRGQAAGDAHQDVCHQQVHEGAPDWPYPIGVIQAAGQIPFWNGDAVPRWKKPVARFKFNQLFPHMQDVYRQISARRLEVRTRKTAPDFAMSSLGPASTYKHHFLQLDKDPEALFRSVAKSSVCQKVTKAEKAGVLVVEAESKDSLSTCYHILARTRRRLCLPPLPFSFFNAMQSFLWPQQMKVFLALHGGKAVGCHIVLISGDLWISEHSGNTDDAIKGVNQLLYWETIRRSCAAGAKTFSFGRTAPSNEGLLSYKRRWATVEEDLVDFVFPSDIVSSPSLLERADRESTVQYRVLKSVLARSPRTILLSPPRLNWARRRNLDFTHDDR